jgi:hypothetical protein
MSGEPALRQAVPVWWLYRGRHLRGGVTLGGVTGDPALCLTGWRLAVLSVTAWWALPGVGGLPSLAH